MRGFRYLEGVATLELDPGRCVGCGSCVAVCPHQVIALKEKKALIADRDACMECGACARNCPTQAVRVDSGVGCASGLINEWLRSKKLAAPGGGCCG